MSATRDRYEAEVRKAYDELVAAIAVQEAAWRAFESTDPAGAEQQTDAELADTVAKSHAWEAAQLAEDRARAALADATIDMIERGWDGASQLERFAAARAVGGARRG